MEDMPEMLFHWNLYLELLKDNGKVPLVCEKKIKFTQNSNMKIGRYLELHECVISCSC